MLQGCHAIKVNVNLLFMLFPLAHPTLLLFQWRKGNLISWWMINEFINLFGYLLFTKAGRLANCYAAIVLADNATFLLTVNRMAAFRSHQLVEHQPLTFEVVVSSFTWDKIFPHCLCPLWHMRLVRNYPASASAERARGRIFLQLSLSWSKFQTGFICNK